ncbi:MAG: tRNA (guanosine(46)-N7)-methyltransferase TrmB [Bacilli bacterium]|jgi:tRNA (guanine-N7-)-methyltransferase|nr:tRNA (guanosine(46)-N7)-methyltransferase TrmB [Bacilli bacterium]
MRLRKIKQAATKLESYPELVIRGGEEHLGKWHDVFQNKHPIYLEIGMGKGKFIVDYAKRFPEINFLGLEKYDSVVLKAARKYEEEKCNNLRFVCADANHLPIIFSKNEIDKIFLNFSDPWPKSRHAKRRLTFDCFLDHYEHILKRPGCIEMKTDNRQLFEYSILKWNERHYRFLEINLHLHEQPNDEIITTDYEEKFKKENKTIYYLKVEL